MGVRNLYLAFGFMVMTNELSERGKRNLVWAQSITVPKILCVMGFCASHKQEENMTK
jgi:primosomal replication protein N